MVKTARDNLTQDVASCIHLTGHTFQTLAARVVMWCCGYEPARLSQFAFSEADSLRQRFKSQRFIWKMIPGRICMAVEKWDREKRQVQTLWVSKGQLGLCYPGSLWGWESWSICPPSAVCHWLRLLLGPINSDFRSALCGDLNKLLGPKENVCRSSFRGTQLMSVQGTWEGQAPRVSLTEV